MLRQGENKIGNPMIIAIAVVLWTIGMLYVSGIGHALKIYERTMIVVFLCLGYQVVRGKFARINKRIATIIVIVFFQNAYFHVAYNVDYISYLWLYFMVAVFSTGKVGERQLRLIGFAYGALGGVLLAAIRFTHIFGGWNTNTLAIQAFFSYTVFAGAISKIRNRRTLRWIFIYSLAYFWILNMLNSRSSILFSIIELLCVFRIIPVKKMLNSKTILIIALIPLIIAIFVVLMRNSPIFEPLNRWSVEHFRKTLFNGRDEIWDWGFKEWQRHALIGSGSLNIRWHNSGVACLVGMGAIGYIIWIYIMYYCWSKALLWIDDDCILGLLTAFMVIWLQQGFDLGIISISASPTIFTILGLLMARINTLNVYAQKESENNIVSHIYFSQYYFDEEVRKQGER